MFKRKTSIFCLLIAVLMMVSASTAAMAASPYDNNLCGASVSYVSNGTPYGYVVLDFSTDCIVTEYVIEEGAHNICDAKVYLHKRYAVFQRYLQHSINF